MCDLHADFASSWKEYSVKHGLAADMNCVEHAIRKSLAVVNKIPSVFDWKRYIKDYPDLQRAFGKNKQTLAYDATLHYLNHGIRENRSVFIFGTNDPYVYDFDWKKYDELNPDVFTQRNRGEIIGKWHCFRHWCEFGYKENRKTTTEQRLSVKTDAFISNDANVSWNIFNLTILPYPKTPLYFLVCIQIPI